MIDYESWTSLGTMLEPSPRYSPTTVGGGPTTRLQLDTSLETAVDLSRKSATSDIGLKADVEADQDDSEDEAPLDLTGSKVRPSSKPAFPGMTELKAEHNMPGPQQREELLRIAELYTSGRINPPPVLHPGTQLIKSENNDALEPPPPSESACSLCGADTQSPDFRPSEHGENICGRGTIACPLCAKTFTLWNHYEAHKKCHQKLKQRQYPCQTCGKIFTSASNRNMHQRIHKGVRPFHCSPCGVFFRQKAHLQKHQKTQGHLQATDVFEKKKRDGLISPDTPVVETMITKKHGDEERESIKSEDSLSASNSSLTSNNGLGPHSNLRSPTPTAAESVQYATPSSTITSLVRNGADDENSPSPTISSRSDSRCKSSPRRKQYRPQHHLAQQDESEADGDDDEAGEEEDEEELDVVTMAEADTSDDAVRAFIDYNDTTHGYDCRQCAFASHDLSIIKDHVKDEHMTIREEKFRCQECQISFSKEFNLRIHNRKHETSSQFLPCDHCEQVFKVPNKLIKHMEGVHSVCPTCGEKQEDKATLIRHLEDAHNENRSKGFHTNLMQFTPLTHLTSPTSLKSVENASENRAEKRRKVDSLAETILQKKQSSMLTNVMNGNETKSSFGSHPFGNDISSHLHKRRKMGSLSPIRRNRENSGLPTLPLHPSLMHLQPELPRHPEGINALVNHLTSKMNPSPYQKNENNNVLSMAPNSLKLPPTIRLPTQPVSGLTPPSSPSPRSTNEMNGHHIHQPGRIRGEVSVTIVHNQNGQHSDDSGEDDSEEPGCLDLSIGKRRRDSSQDEEDHHINTTGNILPPSREQLAELYSRLPFGAGGIQGGNSTFPPFPLPLIGGVIPPPPPGTDPALTEHILKLTAGLQRPPLSNLPTRNLQHPPPPPLSQTPGAVVPSLPIGTSGIAPPQGAQPASLSSPYTNVLSAMLGHVPVGSLQPAFPGLLPLAGVGQGALSSGSQPMNTSEDNNSSDDGKDDSQDHHNLLLLASVSETDLPSDPKKPFRCSYCRKEFAHLTSLESHMEQIHKGEAKHKCELCDRSFSSKSNLTAHKKIHSGERPFECEICQKRFRQKAHLQKHETTHSSATPYQCTVCDKAFGHPSNLNTHMATHSNIRPYACQECGKSYKDSASFKRHRLTHTGEKPYPCQLCNESFIDSKLLKKHREQTHPDARPYPEEEDDGEIVESDVNTSNEDNSGKSDSELNSSSSSRRKKSSNNNLSFGSNTSSSTLATFDNDDISKEASEEEAEIEKEMEDEEEEIAEDMPDNKNTDNAKEVGKVEDEEDEEDKEEKS